MSTGNAERIAIVDALKAIACQLIVLHHLAFYGPMSDHVRPLAPRLVEAFAQHGRLAVHVFLVVAGFLAARRLAPQGRLDATAPLALLARRYLRLLVPYAFVIAVAVAAAGLARGLMAHESIPARPTLAQVLAHLLLVQDVLGFASLSAGFWYVAIDFQLFALFLAILWAARFVTRGVTTARGPGPALVVALGLASLFVFNLEARLDVWAPYFFASYAMGAIAFWATRGPRSALWLVALVLVVLAAVALEFRPRILVALGTALVLAMGTQGALTTRWIREFPLAYAARIAYSVFLVHFAVCLLVNALWTRLLPTDPWVQLVGVVAAWGCSVAAGAGVHRYVETRTEVVLNALGGFARRIFALAARGMPKVERAGSGR